MSRKGYSISRLISLIMIFVTHITCVDIVTAIARRHQERTIRNILQTKIWRHHDNKRNNDNVEILYQTTGAWSSTDLGDPPRIEGDTDLDRISNAIHTTLKCACAQSIVELLRVKTIRMSSISAHLTHINQTILKIISALMDFMKKVLNVEAFFRPCRFLTVTLSLNMHMVRLIHIANRRPIIENRVEIVTLLDRMIIQTVNLVERFIIENCPLNDGGSGGDDEDNDLTTKIKFDRINDMLDHSGLSTTTFLSNGSPAVNSFIVTIIRVIEKLDSVMMVNDRLLRMCNSPRNNVQDILICMDFVFDSIMQIIYRHTLEDLELYEEYAHDANSDRLTSTINDWIDEDAITNYERLIQRSVLAQFPARFVNHVRSMLKMRKDLILYGNVYNSKILKRKIENNLRVLLDKKKFPGLKILMFKRKSLDSYTFIKKILDIREFGIFNQIFQLKRNDGEKDDISDSALNDISYYIKTNDIRAQETCNEIQMLYVLCFDIQSKIKDCRSKLNCLKNMKKSFLILLNAIRDVKNKYSDGTNENLETIAYLINQYLHNILINYPDDEEILYRIPYYVANLIDKYQIHNCQLPTYRREFYATFENDKKRFSGHLKKLGDRDHKELERNFKNEPITKEKINVSLIEYYVDALRNLQPGIRFYWRGVAKTIDEIKNDEFSLIFSFSTFTSYVDAFNRWIVSVLFYTIIDILECFVAEKYIIDNDRLFITYLRRLPSINFPDRYAPTVDFISKAENFYHSINIVEFKMLLEEYLEDQLGMFQQKSRTSEDANATFAVLYERLDRIFNKLAELYNENIIT